MTYHPETITEVINRISSVAINSGQVEVKFKDSEETFTKEEFAQGTFTHELIQLIETFL